MVVECYQFAEKTKERPLFLEMTTRHGSLIAFGVDKYLFANSNNASRLSLVMPLYNIFMPHLLI